MINGASDQLRQWLGTGAMSLSQYQQGVESCGQRPSVDTWYGFFRLLTMVIATGALVFSLLFFIAFNWADMSRFSQFALVQGALVVALLGYFYRVKVKQDTRAVAGWLIVIIAMVIGILLALFGQVYQTGADSWQLFFNWAVLVTPLMVVSRFLPMWLLWMGLCNLTLVLYVNQMMGGITGSGKEFWVLSTAGLNSLFLVCFEWLRDKDIVFKAPLGDAQANVISRCLVLVCLYELLSHMGSLFGDNNIVTTVLLPVWLAGAWLFYYRFRRDLPNLSFCLVALAIYVAWIGDTYVYHPLGSFERLFIASGILMFVGWWGGSWLRKLAHSSSQIALQNESKTTVDKGAELWQQLQLNQVVAKEVTLPDEGRHLALNVMGIFSTLGVLAGIFLLLGLAGLIPAIVEEGTWQLILGGGCFGLCAVFTNKTGQKADFYVLAVVMLIMAQIFVLWGLYSTKLEELKVLAIYFVCVLLQLYLLPLKSLRFMLILIAGMVLIRLLDILAIDGIGVMFFMILWLYFALQEERLMSRLGIEVVTPFTHGLLGVLLIDGIFVVFEYQLFGSNKLTFWQQAQFVGQSLFVYGALVFSCYVVAKAHHSRLFESLKIRLVAWLGLLLVFSVPMVSVALCVMLCGMYLQRRAWVVLGALSLLFFISQFYYDLDTTLNIKSLYLLCFACGVLVVRYVVKGVVANGEIKNGQE